VTSVSPFVKVSPASCQLLHSSHKQKANTCTDILTLAMRRPLFSSFFILANVW
jgi:hypothetical protein